MERKTVLGARLVECPGRAPLELAPPAARVFDPAGFLYGCTGERGKVSL